MKIISKFLERMVYFTLLEFYKLRLLGSRITLWSTYYPHSGTKPLVLYTCLVLDTPKMMGQKFSDNWAIEGTEIALALRILKMP